MDFSEERTEIFVFSVQLIHIHIRNYNKGLVTRRVWVQLDSLFRDSLIRIATFIMKIPRTIDFILDSYCVFINNFQLA